MDFSGMSTVCQKSCEARIARRGVGSAIVVGIIKACGCLPFLRGERSSRQETRKRGRPRRQSLSTRTWNRGGEMRVRPCLLVVSQKGIGVDAKLDDEDCSWCCYQDKEGGEYRVDCHDVVVVYIVAVVPLSPTSRSFSQFGRCGGMSARSPSHPSPSPKSGHVAWAPKKCGA